MTQSQAKLEPQAIGGRKVYAFIHPNTGNLALIPSGCNPPYYLAKGFRPATAEEIAAGGAKKPTPEAAAGKDKRKGRGKGKGKGKGNPLDAGGEGQGDQDGQGDLLADNAAK
jgi:hypothetical protein